MQKDYYQNILYPLQDNVLKIIQNINSDFYLTGGTALSRAYLHHRYSDDLDFFMNENPKFREQTKEIITALRNKDLLVEISVADSSFVRLFVNKANCSLKIDLINDVPYRNGVPQPTNLFKKTDTMINILSNKLTALSRLAAKDVVDIVYISRNTVFDWQDIFNDAWQKDLWINPIEASKILDQFPISKLDEIIWEDVKPLENDFNTSLQQIIKDILEGKKNSLQPS